MRSEGSKWEKAAEMHYLSLGYLCEARNYQCSHCEIDLILSKKSVLVFSEVKYRSSSKDFNPYASISRTKQRHIIRAASDFLQKHRQFKNHFSRFDAVIITGKEQEAKIDLIENAFRA